MEAALERFSRAPPGFPEIPALLHCPLPGRPVGENASPQIGAEMNQRPDLDLRTLPHGGVGMIDAQPFRLHQEPVQTKNLHPMPRRCLTDLPPPGGGEIRGGLRERVGGDLHAVAADLRGVGKHLLDRPALKDLVTEGAPSGAPRAGSARRPRASPPDLSDHLGLLHYQHGAWPQVVDRHRRQEHGRRRAPRNGQGQGGNDISPMQALSPVSAAIRPSTDPLPNNSGCLLLRFAVK